MREDFKSDLLVDFIVLSQQQPRALMIGSRNPVDVRDILAAQTLGAVCRPSIPLDQECQGVEQGRLHDRLGDALGKADFPQVLQVLNHAQGSE